MIREMTARSEIFKEMGVGGRFKGPKNSSGQSNKAIDGRVRNVRQGEHWLLKVVLEEREEQKKKELLRL